MGTTIAVVPDVMVSAETQSVTSETTGVSIDETNFPDPIFRQYVLDNIDYDGDGVLLDNELYYGFIDVSNSGISSLKGIEYFKYLGSLYCEDNQLTSIDISNATELLEFRCNNNNLTSLDVSNNTALTRLECYNNQLIELNLGNNTALIDDLFCYNNQLTELDVSNNTALTILNCSNNQLVALDVSATQLTTFWGYNNRKNINVDSNTYDLSNLEEFGFDASKVIEWYFSGHGEMSEDGIITLVFDENGEANICYKYDIGNDLTTYFVLDFVDTSVTDDNTDDDTSDGEDVEDDDTTDDDTTDDDTTDDDATDDDTTDDDTTDDDTTDDDTTDDDTTDDDTTDDDTTDDDTTDDDTTDDDTTDDDTTDDDTTDDDTTDDDTTDDDTTDDDTTDDDTTDDDTTDDNTTETPTTPVQPVQPIYPTVPSIPTINYPTFFPSIIQSVQKIDYNASAKPTARGAELIWNAVSNADSYAIYQLIDNRYVKIAEVEDTEYTVKNLKNGETYSFMIKARINGKLVSKIRAAKITCTMSAEKPIVNAKSTETTVTLKWGKIDGAEKYAVYKYVNGKAKKIIETEKMAVKIKGLEPETEYSYIVRAYIDGEWTTMTKSDIITVETK